MAKQNYVLTILRERLEESMEQIEVLKRQQEHLKQRLQNEFEHATQIRSAITDLEGAE